MALLVGCSSSTPADVAGNYTVAVTLRDNGCNIANWTVGMSYMNISVTITQSSASATALVTGFSALSVDALLGTNSFTGSVDGDMLDLKDTGTAAKNMGNCTYTYNGVITGAITGDAIAGKLTFTGAGNGNSDCAGITGCVSYEDFNGTRPPQ